MVKNEITGVRVSLPRATISIGSVTVINKAAVTPATIKFIFKDGHRIVKGEHQGLQVLPEKQKLDQLAHDLGIAGYQIVPITVRVGRAASMKSRGRTLGAAYTSGGYIELFMHNILQAWNYYNPYVNLTPANKQRFFSTLAHEVGHLVDYKITGREDYFKNTAIEREERAEQYIRVRFGEEYVRPIIYEYYEKRR